MTYDTSDSKWKSFTQSLIAASSDAQESWLDEGEIRALLHDACASGIPVGVIQACQNACRSREEFIDRLSGVVGKRKPRILAVDDEPEFLVLLALNFQRAGHYDFRTESDSVAAIAVVEEFQPDLCILDLRMPGLDGSQLIDRIRAESYYRDMPVIVVTALLEGTAIEAVTMDNVLHLSKPASWKKIGLLRGRAPANDPQKRDIGPEKNRRVSGWSLALVWSSV
ncbi:MAG: response regulator [Verrucomicrobia bacterium]|nr:response regulator [Verrucomicrobiota bacterium]